MRSSREGSVLGVVLGIVAVVLVIGGILFFVSKPFNTRVKSATRQATQWTPENIQKDPGSSGTVLKLIVYGNACGA